MTRIYAIILLLLSCSGRSNDAPKDNGAKLVRENAGYRWVKMLDSAAWRKNYNFQMFTIRDTMWTMHSEGSWYSLDGKQWQKASLPNIIHNQAFLDYVLRNDTLYGLGQFDGNIETFRFKPAIYRTTNMRQWETLTERSGLPARFFYHPFVFRNAFWIIGGEDKQRQYNDLWRSEDGTRWTQVKKDLPFGERSNSQVVILRNRLYLLNNDVWSSEDGLNWRKETDEIVKGQTIFGYQAIVMDNTIFLLGCNRNGQFTSQVLFSMDGRNWQGMDAPWSPRGGIAATVFRNRIFMTGGKYGGTPDMPDFRYSNDVWALEAR
jgi:hypothetical protein